METEKYKKVFKWWAFVLLILVITTPLTTLFVQGITDSSITSGETIVQSSLITDKIYTLNCVLCVVSIIAACAYIIIRNVLNSDSSSVLATNTYKKKKSSNSKIDIKKNLKKAWPCILLILFMAWTAVGCIQASMEAKAEITLKEYEKGKIENIEDSELKRLEEIANWSSGDRMTNAGDRSWNGCNNLKDGYFSFMFYGTVIINVLLLGQNSDNLKKYLLRILLITSLILVFFSFLSFWDPMFLGGMVKYNRAIFNNSNHYGYYLCIATILSAMMFIKEDNVYFKVIATLSFILTNFMLIINNTFGAYLGVLVALVIIVIAALIHFIKNVIFLPTKSSVEVELEKRAGQRFKTKIEILCAIVVAIIFTWQSFTLVDTTITKSKEDKAYAINAKLYYNNFKTTKLLKYTKLYYDLTPEELAKVEKTNPFSIEELEENKKPIAQRNFEQLGKDIKTMLNHFFPEAEKENNENNNKNNSEENKSGLSTDVSQTGSGRGEVWIKSLDLIKQRPMFGWGLENLLNEFYNQFDINEGRTHNLILQLAGTTGIIGMLLYIVAVIAIFFKVLFNYKNWGYIEYVTVPIFIAYMVSSMFGNSAFYTSPYFMIILGMMIASMMFKKKNEENIKEEKSKIESKK